MKKKFFSMVLFGLVTLGMSTTFQSCKNYDDDISSENDKIAALETKLQNLNETLQDQIDADEDRLDDLEGKVGNVDIVALKQKADAAATDAMNALNAANGAQTTADNAQTAANGAQTTADNAQTAANNAQTTADNAQTYAEGVNTALNTVKTKLEADITTTNQNLTAEEAARKLAVAAEEQARKNAVSAEEAARISAVSAEEAARITAVNAEEAARIAADEAIAKQLKENVENLQSQINTNKTNIANNATEIGKLQTRATNLEAAVERLWSTITGIDVYTSGYNGWTSRLTLTYVAEQTNSFGAGFTDKTIETVKGQYATYGDSLLVRVNPTIANLVNYKDSITLVNSQGKDLSEFIDVTEVHEFEGLLAKSATVSGKTGLWVVKFNLKKNYDAEALAKAVMVEDEDDPTHPKSVAFAVAVKDGENNRYIVSDYEVEIDPAPGTYASNDFLVNKINVNGLHNRYSYSESEGVPTTGIPEFTWNYTQTKVAAAPAVKPTIVLNGTSKTDVVKDRSNVYGRETSAEADDRQDGDLLNVALGEDITIDMSCNQDQEVKGFYVMLDYAYAVESAPSELNAWNSYSYDGVGKQSANGTVISKAKMFEGSTGTIKITSLSDDVKGDIIGFRVFGISYDGTLVDPDGRAFYVKVGESESGDVTLATTDMTFDEDEANQFVAYVPLNGAFNLSTYNNISNSTVSVGCNVTDISGIECDKADDDNVKGKFDITFVEDDKSTPVEANSEDAAYAKVVFTSSPDTYIDGATYTFTLSLDKEELGVTTKTMRKVTFSVTKKMPSEAHDLTFIDGHSTDTYVGTVSPWTDGTNLVVWKSGTTESTEQQCVVDFQEIYYDNTIVGKLPVWSSSAPFWSEFSIAKTAKKTADESLTKISATKYVWTNKNTSSATAIDSKTLVDGTTTYTVNTKYNYGDISKVLKNGSYTDPDKFEISGTAPSIKMHSWIEKLASEFVPVKAAGTEEPEEYVAKIGTTYYVKNPIEIKWNASSVLISFDQLYAAIDATNAGVSSNLFSAIHKYVGFLHADQEFKVMSENGQESNYFTGDLVPLSHAGGYISLKSKKNVKGPDDDVNEYISFQVIDAFGHVANVKVPFIVKK